MYDFTHEDGTSVIGAWIHADKISRPDLQRFKEKILMLQKHGPDVGGSLLVGPIYKNIYKLRITTPEKALRPLLCVGPFDNRKEFTLLLGACEMNSALPEGAVEQADQNRTILLQYPSRRRMR